MQLQWLVAVGVAGVLYFILQSIDDRRADKAHEMRASTSRRIMTFAFLVIICLVLFHFLDTSTTIFSFQQRIKDEVPSLVPVEAPAALQQMYQGIDPNLIQKNMLRAIREDVDVGRPPF